MAGFRDARFGQFADPSFGARLDQPQAQGVLPAPSAPTSASSSFNAPSTGMDGRGVDPSPGNDHFIGAGPSGGGWSPGPSNGNSDNILLAGGGSPGDAQDSGNAAPASNDPFSVVQNALSYGRKKMGLPTQFFGGQGGQGGSDDGEAAAPAAYAEGGSVTGDDGDGDDDSEQGVIPSTPDQGDQGSAGGSANPRMALGYLSGAGAVSPDVAAAMERQIDPRGQMDPSMRKLAAIQQAGSPDKAWPLLQHYRGKFNSYNAFAQAAATGIPGRKPPDLMASTKAATAAYQNLPDGKAMSFMPAQGGVHINVRDLTPGKGAQPQQGADDQDGAQHFAAGGVVGGDEDDPQGETQMAQAGVPPEDQGVIPSQTGEPSRDLRGLRRGATEQVTDEQFQGRLQRGAQATKDFVLSIPQYLSFLKTHGQMDAVLDKGADTQVAAAQAAPQQGAQAAPQQQQPAAGEADEAGPQSGGAPGLEEPAAPAAPKPQRTMAHTSQGDMDITPAQGIQDKEPGEKPFRRDAQGAPKEIADRAAQMFPYVGQNRQRLAWIAEQEENDKKRKATVEASQLKNTGALERIKEVVGGRKDVAKTNAEAKTETNQNTETHKDSRAASGVKSREGIAGANRTSREGIAAAGNASREGVAGANRTSRETEGGLNREAAGVRAVVNAAPSTAQDKGKLDTARANMRVGAPPTRVPGPQQQKPAQTNARQGSGPVPNSPPPPGMKYQVNGAGTQWRLVPAQ